MPLVEVMVATTDEEARRLEAQDCMVVVEATTTVIRSLIVVWKETPRYLQRYLQREFSSLDEDQATIFLRTKCVSLQRKISK